MPIYKRECPNCVHFKEVDYDCSVHTEGWLPGRTNYAMDCDDYGEEIPAEEHDIFEVYD